MTNQHPLEFHKGSARYFTRDRQKIKIIAYFYDFNLLQYFIGILKDTLKPITYDMFGNAEVPNDRNLDLMEAIHGEHAEEIWENA